MEAPPTEAPPTEAPLMEAPPMEAAAPAALPTPAAALQPSVDAQPQPPPPPAASVGLPVSSATDGHGATTATTSPTTSHGALGTGVSTQLADDVIDGATPPRE